MARPEVSGRRRVRVLAAGGTIAMTGSKGATPDLEGDTLMAAAPDVADHDGLEARTVVNARAPT